MDLGGRALQGKPSRCATSFFIDFPFIQAFGLLQFKPIKKPESFDSGFPCRQEHRIIEPDMGWVANNHLTK
jgi:hypothetical protein